MAVSLKQGETFLQVTDLKKINELIKGFVDDKYAVIDQYGRITRDQYIGLKINDEVTKTKVVFSYFDNIKIEEEKYVPKGPAYQSFYSAFEPLKNVVTKNRESDIDKAILKKEWNVSEQTSIKAKEEYQRKWLPSCYAYDINSAYPNVWLKYNAPKVDSPLGFGILEDGQIGFLRGDFNECILVTQVGKYCDERFPICTTEEMKRIRKWVIDKYKKKERAKAEGNTADAKKYKLYMNSAIGCSRNDCVFLYVWTLEMSIREICSKVDENTLFVNVDCIYSSVPRTDLEIGNRIGQFKEDEKNGKAPIYIDGLNYIWGDDKKLRTIPKEIQPYYDLEKGELTRKPDTGLNLVTMEIEKL